MKRTLQSLRSIRNSRHVHCALLSLVTEVEHYGLEGRGHYVHCCLPLNNKMLPGFPLIPGTLDLDLLHQSATAWVDFHMMGG